METEQRLQNVFAAPLAGINLIEASAGTGKTYTITGLYLRLVLEAGRRVDRILVVTYTRAATDELRDRIRRRLVEARAAFLQGQAKDDFCRELLDRYPDRERGLRRLTNAIRGFDEAAIFTIHGFCQRVLGDGAFESGMPFETEILADERDILQEIVDDFWRREFYQAGPLLVHHLLDQGYSPEALLQEIRSHVGKPYLKVLGPEEEPDCAAAETVFTESYQNARNLWQTNTKAIEDLLLNNTSLNGNKYRKSSIPGWIALLDEYLAAETPNLNLFDRFVKFTAGHLSESVKKGQTPPQHAFFTACEALAEAHRELVARYQNYLRALRVRLLAFCNSELGPRKRRKQVQSYDDLLNNLHKALQGRQGQALAEAIQGRYSAALIDEFQDTDPVQYAIFRRIYAGTDLPVFLVGDPKQAIYSFRGADIFAYLRAHRDAGQRYTLDVNWRSDPALIRAMNAVFGRSLRPFLFDDIPFHEAQAAEKDREAFLLEGETEPPLQVWLLGWEENEKPLTKGEAARLAAEATAAEIARLLNLGARGEARIGERPLNGGDIAVLVRNHRQGRQLREALLKLRVPSVQHAQDNVFASWEAQELERLLLAVAEPGREPLVRAALATDMLGWSGEEIHELGESEQRWEERLETFHRYQQLWREHGFMRMFRAWFAEEGIAQRLLGFRDGERRLTNLLHLAELLQAVGSHQRIGLEGLVKWLAERRQSEAIEDETHQLRLESDEQLVKIVTVHKSKGLEYPVVFCPFLWDGRLQSEKATTLSFHDPEDDCPVLDLGSARQEEWRPLARQEELAENLRLCYVALTRARQHCYLVWGPIKEANTAAPAWLLHGPAAGDPAPENAIVGTVPELSGREILADLTRLAGTTAGAIRLEAPPGAAEATPYSPPAQEPPEFRARHFPGPLRGQWRISSFTALAAGHGAETPDYDAALGTVETAPAETRHTIFTFPRGARAGSCLHLIFEQLDFTCRERENLESLTEKTLVEHGFATEWTEVIVAMIERVLATPLGGEQGPRLGDVTLDRRLNELEFYYPLAGLEPGELRRILRQHGPQETWFEAMLNTLAFPPTQGYMKGFIDLIFEADGRFYLVDYKSNWLGMTPADYRHERLREVMVRESYYWQSLIYVLALHRYLRLRLPGYDYERHVGGVFYLFLRGIDPADPSKGIFRDRPARALIDALDAYIAEEG